MMKLKLIVVALTLIFIDSVVFADWEATLKNNFDIVDTFDNDADWYAMAQGDINNPSYLPTKIGGGSTIWGRYTMYDAPTGDPWIGNHTGYNWSGNKSLCIDYNNSSGTVSDSNEKIGYGPSRLSTFFGDGVTGNSGYKTIHVFFMVKFRPDFFARNTGNTGWSYITGYLKMLDICSGFTAVSTWGSASDRASACTSDQIRYEYGLNYNIIDIQCGGGSYLNKIILTDNMRYAYNNGSCYSNNTSSANDTLLTSTNLNDPFVNGEWIGIEIISDIGTLNNADGVTTVKVFSQSGILLNQQTISGQMKLGVFDHKYNKVTLGGNLLDDVPTGLDHRVYYDDFIIHGSEIAPTYFNLINSQSSAAPAVSISTQSQTVSNSPIIITGTSTPVPPATITNNTWSNTLGGSGTFTGTTSWSGPVSLQNGPNLITVTTTDSNGLTGSRTVTITYTPGPVVSPLSVIFSGQAVGVFMQ